MRPGATACVLAAAMLLLLLAAAGGAHAKVQRAHVADAGGMPLAVATWDDEKAVQAGEERGFLVTVEPLASGANLTVHFDVASVDDSVFTVAHVTRLERIVAPETALAFRLSALDGAPPGRYPVELTLRVVNLDASVDERLVSVATLPMNVTVSSLPTPLGETPSTLSAGERWALFGALAVTLGAAAFALARSRRAEDR